MAAGCEGRLWRGGCGGRRRAMAGAAGHTRPATCRSASCCNCCAQASTRLKARGPRLAKGGVGRKQAPGIIGHPPRAWLAVFRWISQLTRTSKRTCTHAGREQAEAWSLRPQVRWRPSHRCPQTLLLRQCAGTALHARGTRDGGAGEAESKVERHAAHLLPPHSTAVPLTLHPVPLPLRSRLQQSDLHESGGQVR